jgi:hypothetical protein
MSRAVEVPPSGIKMHLYSAIQNVYHILQTTSH